jgi:hypothetical protein
MGWAKYVCHRFSKLRQTWLLPINPAFSGNNTYKTMQSWTGEKISGPRTGVGTGGAVITPKKRYQ